MKTATTLADIFNKYINLADDADICLDRNMNDLMMFAIDSEHADFDGDRIILPQGGVVSEIEIERIKGAQDLGSHMAIVLPASMLLVNKTDGSVRVYLPEPAAA